MNSVCLTKCMCYLPLPSHRVEGRGMRKHTALLNRTSITQSRPTLLQDGIRYTRFFPKYSSFFLDAEGVISGIMKILQISSHDLSDIQTLMNSSHTRLLILRTKFHDPFP